MLRVHLGDGEVAGEEFSFGYSAKGLVWYFSREAQYYTVSYDSLTEDVIKFRGVKDGKDTD